MQKVIPIPLGEATRFAPAERADPAAISLQVERFQVMPNLQMLLDNIPIGLMILNDQRQIVFANRSMLNILGIDSDNEKIVMGKRPGEAVACVHSNENIGGCGTTEFCQNCGAVNSILAGLNGRFDSRECHISLEGDNALDLRVTSAPLVVGNDGNFILFSVVDIADEKRRHALERIFFHDILNTVGGLVGLTEVLRDADSEELGSLLNTLERQANRLLWEIRSQRELLAAENNQLEINPEPIKTLSFLLDLKTLYEHHEAGKGRKLRIDPQARETVVTTDMALLQRVLENMIKNALEATPPGETVTIGCDVEKKKVRYWVHNGGFIPRAIQLQIFQRSFSTKGTGRGLGTYSMRLLAHRYLGGDVSFVSTVEGGTVFSLRLPLNK